jgi:signal transduction histidine kinase/CheY-like chemotaxis protein
MRTPKTTPEGRRPDKSRDPDTLLTIDALQAAIVNSPNFCSIATDPGGVIRIFSVGAERMLGYTDDEVTNRITPADISDRTELAARARELSATAGLTVNPGFEALVFKAARGAEDVYELTFIRKDGSRFPAVVSVTALRNVAGVIIGYLLIGTDNGARIAAETALLKAGALQSAIFNSANFSSIATDAEGVIQIFNVGAERMLGYSAREVMNRITPADISDASELIARAEALSVELGTAITPGFDALVFKASRGIEDIYELTYIRKDGTRFPAVVSVTALRDESDNIIGYLLIGTDNTARKQVEEERRKLERALQQKNVELENASRMKSEFLANMSHELRTPLNAIIGFSEVLGDGLLGDMTDKQRRFIGDIFKSGKHLLSLINDILDLSKVEAGKMLLDLEPVEMEGLLGNSLSIIKGQAAARHIGLDLELPERLGSLNVDGRKLKQIVYNLLSNAVKFSSNGGKVVLRAEPVPRAQVGAIESDWASRAFPLAESDFSSFLRLSVSDEGMGMAPDSLEHLFKPFSQVDSGLSRQFEGTGLGLAMVKLLADLHGGSVAVESAVGKGSRFTVWIPMRSPEDAEASAAVEQKSAVAETTPVASDARRQALVVESNPRSAELIRLQLEAEGFTVVHARNAREALALTQREPLALITLDIMMRDVDGWAFLEELKRNPTVAAVPVIIVSILPDRERGVALGAAAVMQSPVSRQELYDTLVALGLAPRSPGGMIRVLIVDDDPKAVELIAVRIRSMASVIHRAYNGREAVAIASREIPDLIVLDLMMPEMDGFEVVEALNGNPRTAQIPVVIVTASDATVEERKRLQGVVTAVIGKAGFNSALFMDEVRAAVGTGGAPGSAD